MSDTDARAAAARELLSCVGAPAAFYRRCGREVWGAVSGRACCPAKSMAVTPHAASGIWSKRDNSVPQADTAFHHSIVSSQHFMSARGVCVCGGREAGAPPTPSAAPSVKLAASGAARRMSRPGEAVLRAASHEIIRTCCGPTALARSPRRAVQARLRSADTMIECAPHNLCLLWTVSDKSQRVCGSSTGIFDDAISRDFKLMLMPSVLRVGRRDDSSRELSFVIQ